MRLEEALEKHGGRESLSEYERGWLEGASTYAWFKDGSMQVGTTGTLLGDAIDRFLTEHRATVKALASARGFPPLSAHDQIAHDGTAERERERRGRG